METVKETLAASVLTPISADEWAQMREILRSVPAGQFGADVHPAKGAIEILKEASRLLGQKGWIQFNYSTHNGYCAYGAIQHASYYTASYGSIDLAVKALWLAINESASVGAFSSIPTWNDSPGRSYEDVQLAFKQAIERIEKEYYL